jgi:hypothetical protein
VDEQLIDAGRLRPLAAPEEIELRKRGPAQEPVRRDPRDLLGLLLGTGSDV